MAMKRAFIFGAGFSAPAGMPVATGLLPLLIRELGRPHDPDDEMQVWLDSLSRRLAWLQEEDSSTGIKMNIEEVFHYAHFDVQTNRLLQHRCPVGRGDGPCTDWSRAESIEAWLSHLENALRDVIHKQQDKADPTPIDRWAQLIRPGDCVLTFNYDLLAERSLEEAGIGWNHGFDKDRETGIPVFKLHGSIDWIVAHRRESPPEHDLLFDKPNENRTTSDTGHVEDDYRLWRCRDRDQLAKWIEGRDLQLGTWKTVGIAGLGAYKQLHVIPGLGEAWIRGMQALREADETIIVGFSLSDFDAMAQLQFAQVAHDRLDEGRPLTVKVIDPAWSDSSAARFRRVFREVEPFKMKHQEFEWDRSN